MSSNRFSKLGCIAALAVAGILASCATTRPETIEQPDLAALAQPYAARLESVGVSRIETPVGGAQFVSVETPLRILLYPLSRGPGAGAILTDPSR